MVCNVTTTLMFFIGLLLHPVDTFTMLQMFLKRSFTVF